jgi:hypothetical protein
VVPKRHRRVAWIVATVSHWELEEQEVEITLESGVVQDVEVGVRRAQLPLHGRDLTAAQRPGFPTRPTVTPAA